MLRVFWRALRYPEAAPVDTSLTRRFLLKPRVFDMVSALIQLRQTGRISRIPIPMGASPREETIRHNYSQISKKPVTRTRRVEVFYQIATMPNRNVSQEKVLAIGCRSIHELYEAMLYGFRWENLIGADLLSSHPKIREADMHTLPFPDACFDVVTMINTLGYSETPHRAIEEALRILRPGGRFVFNHVYRGIADSNPFSKTTHIRAAAIIETVRKCGGAIYFYDPQFKYASDGLEQISHNLGVIKIDQSIPFPDRLPI